MPIIHWWELRFGDDPDKWHTLPVQNRARMQSLMFLTSELVPFATCQAVNPKELLRIWQHLALVFTHSCTSEPLGVFLFFYFLKTWNTSRICVSSLRRGHANLLCIVPILVYVLPKGALGCFLKNRYIGIYPPWAFGLIGLQ